MPGKNKVLVIGGGGREHAIAWALSRSPQVKQVFVAPGNGGTTWPGDPNPVGLQPGAPCQSLAISDEDFPALMAFARGNDVALTVVGPEAPLAAGIVDAFQADGLTIWGPTQAAAQLEAAKSFAKDFMMAHNIPTAAYAVFDDYDLACQHVSDHPDRLVIKADGLTAGKGVLINNSVAEAHAALRRIMIDRVFGEAGAQVVVEEKLAGREISVLAFTDGKSVVPMPLARDHKCAYDGDAGPNTGGMGAYVGAPDVDAAFVEEVCRTVLQPAVDGMTGRGTPYAGVLYAGLMITDDGPRVLEFNCRFGDPETQVILPLLETDLYAVFQACIEGTLADLPITWHADRCATIVAASPGYPGPYPTGLPIKGVADCEAHPDVIVFQAGTRQVEGRLLTAGGRVLAVTAVGAELGAALRTAYTGMGRIHFDEMHYRRDIGQQFLQEVEA